MRTFGAIFATLTLALSASAAAIFPRDGLVTAAGALVAGVSHVVENVNVVKQQDIKNRQVGNPLSSLGSTTGNTGSGISDLGLPGLKRGDEPCYTDLIKAATLELEPIIVKIEAVIDLKIVDVVELEGLLHEVLDIVVKLVADVRASIVANIKVALDLDAIVAIVVGLLNLVICVLIKVVAKVKVEIVVGLCGSIIAQLVIIVEEIVKIVVGIAAKILAELTFDLHIDLVVALVKCLGGH